MYDLARGTAARFTFNPGMYLNTAWAPDSSALFYTPLRAGIENLYRRAAKGGGEEELVLKEPTPTRITDVSRDGRWLLFTRRGDRKVSGIWALPLKPDPGVKPAPRAFVVQNPFMALNGRFSPDGSWVAYESDESGKQVQIYAAPFPGPGGKRQISPDSGRDPRWSRDGKEIFYVSGNTLMAAEVAVRGGTLEVGKAQKLFDGIPAGDGERYDVTPDGKRFLVISEGEAQGAPRPLTLVQNWTAALKK